VRPTKLSQSLMSKSKGWSASILSRAILSASCGSLASVCGKIAFDSSENSLLVRFGIDSLITKILVGLLILFFNSVMLSLYIRVLQAVSALQASLLAFVCNYLVSTVIGLVLFGEIISYRWIAGAMLMTLGAIRISSTKTPATPPRKVTRKVKKN